jgi:hypothetical protein
MSIHFLDHPLYHTVFPCQTRILSRAGNQEMAKKPKGRCASFLPGEWLEQFPF